MADNTTDPTQSPAPGVSVPTPTPAPPAPGISAPSPPPQAPAPGINAPDPVINQQVTDNTQNMPAGFVSSFPNAALWTATSPTGQADAVNKAYSYLSSYYGQNVATQILLYSLPPAQRALALQQIQAKYVNAPTNPDQMRVPTAPGDLTRQEFGDQLTQQLGAQPDDSILQHFQRLISTALVKPEQVLGTDTTKALDQIAAQYNSEARGEVLGSNIPVVSALLGHVETNGTGITLNADWVRAHPGQAMALQEYMAEKTNGGFKVDIQNSGIAAAVKSQAFDLLNAVVEPASVSAALVGMVGNQITQAVSHGPGKWIAHLAGYSDQEIDTAAKQTGTMNVIGPSDFIKQVLDTNIPMAGMAGAIVGGFGMRADDPRVKAIEMGVGAAAGFTALDPINALGELSSGVRLAGKLPVAESTVSDAERLSTLAETMTKSWLAKRAFMANIHSIEDVTASTGWARMNQVLSDAVAAVKPEEAVGEMAMRLKQLKLPTNLDLARSLVQAAGDPEKMAQVWQSWFMTVERAPSEIRTALMSYKTANDSINRLQNLVDGDLSEGEFVYRGEHPDKTPNLIGGNDWSNNLFASKDLNDLVEQSASGQFTGYATIPGESMGTIERMQILPSAKVLREGTDEFNQVVREAGIDIPPQYADQPFSIANDAEGTRFIRAAKARGYQVIDFADQTGHGTVIMDESAVVRGAKLPAIDALHAEAEAWQNSKELENTFAARDQLMAQRQAAENILREGERPILARYPDYSRVRDIAKDLRPRGTLGKMFDYITHFPQSAGLESLSAGLDRWNTHFPSGEFHDPMLATDAEKVSTIENLTDLGKYLRVPRDVIRRAVQSYADLKDTEAFYDWSIAWRSDFADSSKIMDPLTRDAFKQVYADVGRGPGDMMRGVLNRADDTGHVTFEPVAYEEVPSTDGLGMTRRPVAIEPSEWTRSNMMPSSQQLRDQISLYRKFARRVPFGKDFLAMLQNLHMTMDQAWAAMMIAPRNLFKTLFARVFTENTFSLMAAGRANALTRDGWLDLVKDTTIDPAAIIGDPNEALGTLKTTIEGDARTVMSKGKALVSPGDAFYGRSISSYMQQLYEGSPRLTIALMDKSPEEVLAWLRGETPEVQNTPIGELLSNSAAHDAEGNFIPLRSATPDNPYVGFDATGSEGSLTQAELQQRIREQGFDATRPIIRDTNGQVVEGFHRLEAARAEGETSLPSKTVDVGAVTRNPGEGSDAFSARVENSPGVINKVSGGGPGTYDYDRIYQPWSRQVARTQFSELEMLQRMKQVREQLVAGEPAMREALRTGTYINATEYEAAYNKFMQDVSEMEGGDRELFTQQEWEAKARQFALEQTSEKVGGAAFAKRLQTRGEEAAQGVKSGIGAAPEGQWLPPSNVAGRYPLQSGSGKADMFGWFDKHLAGKFGFEDRLIKPEMKYLRIPTFKEFYGQELARLESVGVTGDRASQLAGEQAATQTRAMFRDFTTATAADRWMRQFSWFFPAWKNIAERWLKVIPEARGGAVIGQLSTIRFAQNVRNLAEGLGIIRKGPDGSWYATIPGVNELLSHFTGYQLKINPASLSLFGTLPSLNASITVPLTIGHQIPGLSSVVDHIASLALPFGDVSIAPSFADSLWWAATGAAGKATTPPWELVSRSSQETRLNLAMADSMRMARTEIGPPPMSTSYTQGDADPRYRADYTKWSESIITRGRMLFAGVSFLHGLSMLASPASINMTPKWIDKTGQLYKSLSIFPSGSPVSSALIDQFNRQYPNANWFLTGKTITNGSSVPTPNGFNEYLQQLNDHVRRVLTPDEYTAWAAGIEELNALNVRQQDVVDKLGGNLEGVLMNYHTYRGAAQDMHQEFSRYLMWNKQFATLWSAHKNDVPAKAGESYFQTQELLATRNDMGNVANLFTDSGIVDGDYNTMKAKISDELNNLNYNVPGQPSSQIAQDLKWYWDTVATPYYDQLSKLYTKLDSTPVALRQPLYDQIRKLNDSQGSTSYHGMSIPSPEEVSFNGLSNDAQKEKVAHWAINKVTYLDNFQLAQAYPDAPKGLGELTTFMSKGETLLAQSGLSTSSREYDAAKASIVAQDVAEAQRLGVDPSWVQMQDQPAFIRLKASGFGAHNSTLQTVINATINDWNLLSAHGESPRGSTADAITVQQQIAQMVADGRAKDPIFDRLMSRLEIASAPAGTAKLVGVDMVMRVFFDTITPAPYAVAAGGSNG